MNKIKSNDEFKGWRAAIWPIHNYELKKFLPLGMILFCILYNYTLLRDTKDTLFITSAGAGGITFLKLYCVTPIAILFVVIYAKLSNIFKREHVFYVVMLPFLLFFGVFGFLIYPNLDVLHPSPELISTLQASYPRLAGFIDIYAYWSFSIFFVLSELWGSAMIALMFWQFANHVVRMKESKRFYGLFAVIANLALILSGQTVGFCSKNIQPFFETKEEAFKVSMYLLMGATVFIGLLSVFIYRWMHVKVLTDKRYFDEKEQAPKQKKKKKPSLAESFKIICKSPELGLIATLIIAYGITINLVEVQFKNQVNLYCAGDKGAVNYFMGQYSTITGFATILFGLFFGSNILRRFSWCISALVTPMIITLGGILFFTFIFCSNYFPNSTATAAFLGAGIVIFSKAVKYILFDSTKEMAYIPLDDELKTKGKAAVDVIGGRAGKAGGAFVQNMLLLLFATKDVITIAPYAFVIFALIALLWLFAVKILARKVDRAMAKKQLAGSE